VRCSSNCIAAMARTTALRRSKDDLAAANPATPLLTLRAGPPSPCVSSRIAATMSCAVGSITSAAPNCRASLRRSGATRFAALQLDPSQRAPGRAGAAGDGGPGDEGERVGQRHQRRHRHLHVLRVAAVTAGAVDHRSLEAHLRPARAAVLAVPAAVVMVVHHAFADPGFLVGDGGAHCRDDAAGLVTGDHAGRPLDATRGI